MKVKEKNFKNVHSFRTKVLRVIRTLKKTSPIKFTQRFVLKFSKTFSHYSISYGTVVIRYLLQSNYLRGKVAQKQLAQASLTQKHVKFHEQK